MLVAEKGAGEYAFLDLTLNAFDLSDRGVKGRDASGPIDAYVYTERGVYRGGEEVNVTALVRDRARQGVRRADDADRGAPRWRRTRALCDERSGPRRPLARRLPLAKTAMTGTWRALAAHRSEAPAIAERAFLVEDFVPERLDMKLEAAAPALVPGRARNDQRRLAAISMARPPRLSALKAKSSSRPRARMSPGFAGYHVRTGGRVRQPGAPAARRQSHHGRGRQGGDPRHAAGDPEDRQGRSKPTVIVKLREDGGRTIERNDHASCRYEAAAHRHQAAVRRHDAAGRRRRPPSMSCCSTPTANRQRPTNSTGR